MRRTSISVVVAVAGVIAACGGGVGALPGGAVPSGVAASPIDVAPGMISMDEAIAAASKHLPSLAGATVEAHLVSAIDPTTVGADRIAGQSIWIVHASGISMPVSIPAGVSLASGEGGSVSNGYVYIDAFTGDWLMSRFE